jgi:hemoglobin
MNRRWLIVVIGLLAAPSFADAPAAQPTLYDRLGGLWGISQVVDDFMDRLVQNKVVMGNPQVAASGNSSPLPYLKFQVSTLVCAVTGGPCKYAGKNMKDSHIHLKITEAEWVAMAGDFKASLDKFKVPAAEQKELVAILNSTHNDIVLPPGAVAEKAPPPQAPAAPSMALPPDINVAYFAPGSSTLDKDGKTTLEQIVDFMKKAPGEKIALYGFCDPTGSAAANAKLLEARLQTVRQFVVSGGIDAKRIDVPTGYQQTPPDNYPKDEYWRLRKVQVQYSAKVNDALEARAKADDAAAEGQGAPDSAPAAKAGSKTAAAPAGGSNTADDGNKLEKIDVLYWKSPTHSLFLLAKRLKFFQDEGFDVRLHESSLEANQMAIQMAEGKMNVRTVGVVSADEMKKPKYFLGAICPYGLHDALSKKLPVVQIGSMLTQTYTAIMKKALADAAKKDLNALSGKTIARLKYKSTDIDYALILITALKERNISFNEKWFTSDADAQTAVFKGEVDAAVALPPGDLALVDSHPGFAMFDLYSLYPEMPCCRQLVTRDHLKDKKTRDKYVRFERALIRAHQYFRENLPESVNIISSQLAMDPSYVRRVFLRNGFDLDPNPNTKGAMAFYNTIKKELPGPQDVRESVDTSVYEEALLSLAKENPDKPYFKEAIQKYRSRN